VTSFQLTLYSLFLGNQDADTGWYRKGYVIKYARVAIIPKGVMHTVTGLGYYSRHDALGLTQYEIKVGDTLKTTLGAHYLVVNREPFTWADKFVYYALDLEEQHDFPFIAGFFGFEDAAHGTVGGMFEDGFERGYWAL
jgi:hypothetical protein